MKAKLYVLLGAHPSRTAMLMLDHKGIEYETVHIPPGLQPLAMRRLGFTADPNFSRSVDDQPPFMLRRADRMGTVPALLLRGERVMTNRRIARFLDEIQPEPPLFPADSALRGEVEEAERWGDEVFQMAARRIILAAGRRGSGALARNGDDGRLGPLLYRNRTMRTVTARIVAVIAFRANSRTEPGLLAALPAMLDRIDAWVEAGVLNGVELNAADYMIAPSLAVLTYRPDVAEEIEGRPAIALVDRVLPDPARPAPMAVAA
jgi:glutathione S-transferase